MRAPRPLFARLASLGGAIALTAAGLAGSIGLAASSGPAGADSPQFTATCTIAAAQQLIPTTITGSISPDPVAPGHAFGLSNFGLQTQLSQATAQAIQGQTLTGTFTTNVISTGATPSSEPVTFNIPSTTVPNPVTGPLALTATGTAVSFTADSTGASSVALSVDVTGTISVVVNGVPISGPCTNPSQQIASAPIALPAGTLQAVLPNASAPAGGGMVKIAGLFLSNPTAVTFGGVPATSFTSLTPNSVEAVVPPGSVGTAPVQVTTPAGPSNTLPFTYTDGPIVSRRDSGHRSSDRWHLGHDHRHGLRLPRERDRRQLRVDSGNELHGQLGHVDHRRSRPRAVESSTSR